MSYKVLPLFKSHFSIGKSILTLDEPTDKKGNPVESSVFHLLKTNKLETLVLVEDNVSGLLQASKVADENKVKLVFGVRITVVNDMAEKNEDALKKVAKYIIFVKSPKAYQKLIKIWSAAAKEGFYYEPRIDFKTLKSLWDDKLLQLAVPFYDSFLYLNSYESHTHVPDFGFTKPVIFIENNDLPFDDFLAEKVEAFAKQNKLEIVPAQSIFYQKHEDYLAYLTRRCIDNRTSIEKPELQHMASNEFCFEKWMKLNEQ
jgi:DNA polymerase III subunit alpha